MTYGHVSVIRYGLSLPFDKLIVGIGVNPMKKTLFTREESKQMLDQVVQDCFPNDLHRIETDVFENLYLVDYCAKKGAGFYLRGLRGEDDFRFEQNMVRLNRRLRNGHIQPIWFPTEDATGHMSSSTAKALVGPEGWQQAIVEYLPPPVYNRFLEKFQ